MKRYFGAACLVVAGAGLSHAQPGSLTEFQKRCAADMNNVACAEAGVREKNVNPDFKALVLIYEVSDETANWYAVHDSNSSLRRELVQRRITDESTLREIALRDKNDDVRVEAIQKTKDQSTLEAVVLSGAKARLRFEAIRRVQNQDLVTKVALNRNEDSWVRTGAARALKSDMTFARLITEDRPYYSGDDIELEFIGDRIRKMTDQQALGVVVWDKSKTRAGGFQVVAAEQIKDQKMLADLAQRHPELAVQLAAVSNLSDQVLLRPIVLNHPHEDVRWRAVGRLTDQALVEEVLRTTQSENIRNAAAGRVTNPTLLRELSKDPSAIIRSQVAPRLTDEADLIRIVENEPQAVALRVIERVANVDLLKRWAGNHKDPYVRWAAIRRLPEGAELRTFRWELLKVVEDGFLAGTVLDFASADERREALQSSNHFARAGAVSRMIGKGEITSDEASRLVIEDRSVIVREVAMRAAQKDVVARALASDPEFSVRLASVNNLPLNHEAIVRAAIADPHELVRRSAVGHVQDADLAARVTRESSDTLVRRAAIRFVTDRGLLQRLERSDPDPKIRSRAKERLAWVKIYGK